MKLSLAFVAQGKGQPDTFQKIQIFAELDFLCAISEYACVNFLRTYFDFTNSLPLSVSTRAG